VDRRAFLATAGAGALAAALAGCSAPTSDGGGTETTGEARLANPDFESGLDGWTVGRDVPTDPNTGDPVYTHAAVTTSEAATGEHSLALTIDGRQDDGTIWVQQSIDLSAANTLAVGVWSPADSFNAITKVAAYAGPDPGRPLRESDFDTSTPVEDHEGWKTDEYDVTGATAGLVAVGVSVVWETEVTRYLDAVSLQ